MDFIQFCTDYNIPYITENHRHAREGWVNIKCPFCVGNPGMHLGYNQNGDFFSCWRCGGHSIISVISTLLQINYNAAKKIILHYDYNFITKHKNEIVKQIKKVKLPSGIRDIHKNDFFYGYLQKRKFIPEQIINDWKIKALGPVAYLNYKVKKIEYKNRLFIPIYYKGQIISFQTRDITEKHPQKYKMNISENEIIPVKHILYGNSYYWSDNIIIVEGVTDVWRLGGNSAACFGIKYKTEQIRFIAKYFNKVNIMFDPENQAQKQAKKLQAELQFRGLTVNNIIIDSGKDPGELTDQEIINLKNKIL